MFSTGSSTHRALTAAQFLAEDGVRIGLVDVFRLKPVNEAALWNVLRQTRTAVTVEEHSVVGGLAAIVADIIARGGLGVTLHPMALPDRYLLGSASRSWAERAFGLTGVALVDRLRPLACGRS